MEDVSALYDKCNFFILGHIRKNLVSRPSAQHFWRAHQENFYFSFHWIWCNWHCNQLFFGESTSILSFTLIKIRAYPILRSTSMIEIHLSWYVENVKLFLSQKSQFDLVEKIKDKNRMRASLFQSSEEGNKKSFLLPNAFSFISWVSIFWSLWIRKWV